MSQIPDIRSEETVEFSCAATMYSRKIQRRAGILVIGMCIALLVAGCSIVAPSVQVPSSRQLIGLWVNTRDGGSLRLSEDGTFVMKGVPAGVLRDDQPDSTGAPVGPAAGGTGRWTIQRNAKVRVTQFGGVPTISLLFSRTNPYAYGLNVYVSHAGGAMELYVPFGDPDLNKQYAFKHAG